MPYYDSVKFTCPNCKSPVSVENKKADEGLTQYVETAVPLKMAKGIIGETVICGECFETLVVSPRAAEFVCLQLTVKG